MNTVSENLKRIRVERGLTQQQMADLLFVTQQTVSGWEKGKAMPSVDALGDIAEKLGVEIYDLLYGYDENRKKQKMKVVICGVISAVLFVLWQVFGIIDFYRSGAYFELQWRYAVIYFLRPFALFFISCTIVCRYKLNFPVKKQSKQWHKFLKIAVVVFMFIVVLQAVGLFFAPARELMHIFMKDLRWLKVLQQPWLFSVLGLVYGVVEK